MALARVGVRIPMDLVAMCPPKFRCRTLAGAVISGMKKEHRESKKSLLTGGNEKLLKANEDLKLSATALNSIARMANIHGHLEGDPTEIYRECKKSLVVVLAVLRRVPNATLNEERKLSAPITLNIPQKIIYDLAEKARSENITLSRLICRLIRRGLDSSRAHQRSGALSEIIIRCRMLVRNVRGSITCIDRSNVVVDQKLDMLRGVATRASNLLIEIG